MRELNRTEVVNKNLHEIKNEILRDYVGEFEMVGNLKVGDQIRQTHINLELLMIMNLILMILIKTRNRKMLFLMVMFIKSILLNITESVDPNMEMDVILNMKLLNIGEIIALYPLKDIILLNVSIF